jgi:hypothetical protein
MKKATFLFPAVILAASISSMPLSGDAATDAVAAGLSLTTKSLAEYVTENTTQLNVSPEAYIGKLFPSVPPHFSLGFSLSGTVIDTSSVSNTIDSVISDMQGTGFFNFTIPNALLLPAYSVNVRIGGFLLPFDAGVFGSFASVQNIKYADFSASGSEFTIGADVRYAVLEGNVILPKISIGAGYIYTRQSYGFGASKTYTGTYNSNPAVITSTTDVGIRLNMNILYLQAQVSKKVLFFIPYAGFRAVVVASDNSYEYKSNVNANGTDYPNSTSGTTASGGFDFAELQPQIFAGIGFNVLLTQFNVNACWNPRSNIWSGSVSSVFRM